MLFVTEQNTQINIPPISTNHKLTCISEKNIRRYCKEQPLVIWFVEEQGTIAADISKSPTALPLKWLKDKSARVEQWPLTTEKL